jgi:hypothetical protein
MTDPTEPLALLCDVCKMKFVQLLPKLMRQLGDNCIKLCRRCSCQTKHTMRPISERVSRIEPAPHQKKRKAPLQYSAGKTDDEAIAAAAERAGVSIRKGKYNEETYGKLKSRLNLISGGKEKMPWMYGLGEL